MGDWNREYSAGELETMRLNSLGTFASTADLSGATEPNTAGVIVEEDRSEGGGANYRLRFAVRQKPESLTPQDVPKDLLWVQCICGFKVGLTKATFHGYRSSLMCPGCFKSLDGAILTASPYPADRPQTGLVDAIQKSPGMGQMLGGSSLADHFGPPPPLGSSKPGQAIGGLTDLGNGCTVVGLPANPSPIAASLEAVAAALNRIADALGRP